MKQRFAFHVCWLFVLASSGIALAGDHHHHRRHHHRHLAPLALKPPLQGAVSNGLAIPSYREVVDAFVVNVYWKDIQLAPGAAIESDNAIDRALDQVRQLEPELNVKIKLRIFSGIHAPEWAKSMGGEPFWVRDPQGGASGTIGRFWSDKFGEAYADLQEKLAAQYDGEPEILEVTISRCSTVYAEPFIRGTADRANIEAFLAAGYTMEADQQCQRDAVEAHQVWQSTRSSLAFNPWQFIRPNGTAGTDESFTEEMMDYCRQSLRERCVLENNSIRWPPLTGWYPSMYSHIRELGPPITFQTAAPSRIGDWWQTLNWAVEQGANAVELNGSYTQYPLDELADLDVRLTANPTSSSAGQENAE